MAHLQKGNKANFRRAYKKFNLVNTQLMYKSNRFVIFDDQRRRNIIHDVYQGLGDNTKALH